MRVYDLLPKLEGLKALCGGGLKDDTLAQLLFPMLDPAEQRSGFSRLKGAESDLSQEKRDLLTEFFNDWINTNVLKTNGLRKGTGLLRSGDWERPVPAFFGHLAASLEPLVPNAVARTHAGIIKCLHGLEEYAEYDHALLIATYDPADTQRYRFPDSARPADPRELPPTRVTAGKPMVAALTRQVTDEPSRGWLFFVRDPDERQGLSQSYYVWDQDLSQMIYWQANSPFDIPASHIGPLPGYPTAATRLTGKVTAFLLVEPLNSPAIGDLLGSPENRARPPTFENTVHLITRAQRLFQIGNSASYRRGKLTYQPPKLYMRRYKIDPPE